MTIVIYLSAIEGYAEQDLSARPYFWLQLPT